MVTAISAGAATWSIAVLRGTFALGLATAAIAGPASYSSENRRSSG
jgi:hypothetical protein